MILIGRFRSPYVRRVAVTLNLYGMDFEHRRLSPWEHADQVSDVSPLGRVPALITNDGDTLVDSAAIIGYLDHRMGAERALIPRDSRESARVFSLLGIAQGAVEKGVAAIYERDRRPAEKIHFPWLYHCENQSKAAFEALDRMAGLSWMVGEHITHADVATVVFWEFTKSRRRSDAPVIACPSLDRISARAAQMPAFRNALPEY